MLNLYPPANHAVHNGATLNFAPDIDHACQSIHYACKGLGTDEKALITVLGTRSADERYLISVRFQQLYGRALTKVLKGETSGDFGRLLQFIACPLPEAEAAIIRRATKGLDTKEKLLYPIIMGRTNVELAILRKTYFEKYGHDLGSTLDGELSGDLKKVILASLQAPVEQFNPALHTPHRGRQTPMRFTRQDRVDSHLRAINEAYVHKRKNDLIKAVKKEFSGDAEYALLFLVRMALEPLELISELFEKTMKGFGTDENALSAALVRYHRILDDVRPVYKKKYGKELRNRIHGEVSGDYRKLLLAVFDAPNF